METPIYKAVEEDQETLRAPGDHSRHRRADETEASKPRARQSMDQGKVGPQVEHQHHKRNHSEGLRDLLRLEKALHERGQHPRQQPDDANPRELAGKADNAGFNTHRRQHVWNREPAGPDRDASDHYASHPKLSPFTHQFHVRGTVGLTAQSVYCSSKPSPD